MPEWAKKGIFADKVRYMIEPLSHRGPDGSGVWHDEENGVAIGHTRLSVLDVSKAGSQPMVSSSGRYVITFNGEIYNHLELRSRLLLQEVKGNGKVELIPKLYSSLLKHMASLRRSKK